MSKDIELGIKLKIDGKDADGKLKIIASDLEKITAATQKHGNESERSYSKTRQGLESISKQLSSARHLAEQFFAVQYSFKSAQALIQTADQYSLMSARLKVATQSAQEFATAQTRINDIARTAQAPLQDVARLYTRLAESSRDYAGGQENQLKVTEAVVNSLKASGASIAETSSTITQLSQVLSSGTAQWEDFGQLTDTNIKLVRVVLKGLSTDMGQLKKDMSAGKVSSQQVFEAILKGYEQLKAEAAAMPKTVGGSVQEMANQFQQYVGKVDQASGVSQSLASTISDLSGHMKEMVTVAGSLATGMAGLFAASLVSRIGNVANAILGVRTAMLLLSSHPLIAVATAGATYLGYRLLSDADLTRLESLKQKLTDLEQQTTHPGFAGPIKGRDEAKIAAIKAEIAAIESKAKAEDDAKQAKAKADQEEEARIRKDKADADASNVTTLHSDIELLKARGKMREAYELEAKGINNLTAADQARYVQNKLAVDAINAQLNATQAGEQAKSKAQQEALKIEERYQALRDQARTSDEVFIDTVAEYTAAYNANKLAIGDANLNLERYINLLTQADAARDKSQQKANPTVQAVPYFTEGGQSLDNYTAADKAINTELDQASKSAEEYDKWLNQINDSLSKMGATSADVFDGVIGGFSLLRGAVSDLAEEFTRLNGLQAENNARLASEREKAIPDQAAIQKGMETNVRLENEQTKAAVSGAARIAAATSQMFEKKSGAAKAFHALSVMLSAARMAMDLKETLGSIAAGAAKFFAQSGWLGFAGVAAMLGVMAAVGFSKSSTATPIPTSPDAGTVLGDPSAKSASINNSYELLKEIHAKEYRELRGINSGVAALKQGITDSVTKLFQSGGLKLPDGMEFSKYNLKPITMIDPVSKWLAGFIVGGLFGKTTQKVTGSGIYAGGTSLADLLAGEPLNAQQYTEITKTKKSWFSKKVTVSEMLTTLDPEFHNSLSKMFKGMATSMMSMATEFGSDMTTTISDYVIPSLKISLHGMSSEDMIKTLNNVLSTQLDTMTTSIFGSLIAKYQKLGEGMFETATRLVAEKAVVLDAIDMVGSAFKGDAVEMADGLITLAGGIKEFQGLFQDYYRNFYTEAEQLANTTRRLIARLGDYGLLLPDTRSAYRDLVNAQQLDTQAGRERYNQLLELADAADTYYQANEKLRESMELLSKDTFATAVDYTRYLRLAQLAGIAKADSLLPPTPDKVFMPNGLPGQTLPGINPGTTATSAYTTIAQSNQVVADEVRQLRIEIQAQEIAIAQATADTARILKRWNGDGMPAVRTIA